MTSKQNPQALLTTARAYGKSNFLNLILKIAKAEKYIIFRQTWKTAFSNDVDLK